MEMHSDTKGRSSRRVGTACEPLTISQAAALQDDRRRVDWSAQASDLDVDAVAPEAVDAARVMLRRFDDDRRALAEAPVEDLLVELGVLRDGGAARRRSTLLRSERRHPDRLSAPELTWREVKSSYRDEVPGLLAYREVLRRIQDNSISSLCSAAHARVSSGR
jgi:ATP-dependent DNA helicase RecG